MGGSITIAQIRGIAIRIHFSWVFVLALLTWSLATTVLPENYKGWSTAVYWLTGAIAALLLFVSVLLHELSHSFVALARGLPVSSITLFIFGGVSQIDEEARSPGGEFWVSIVGPLSSIVIAVICFALTSAGGAISPQVKAVLTYLASVNLLLGLFNLLPGFPLDGGRVLRSLVWAANGSLVRATVVAATVSRLIAFMMIFGGLLWTFNGGGFSGLWLAFIGWFLENAAGASLQQTSIHALLDGARVREAMATDVQTVVPALPITALIEDYVLPGHQRSFPVAGGGHLWGIVTLADIARAPQERWATTPVEAVMTPRERLQTTTPETLLEDVVPRLQQAGHKQLVVLEPDGERVAGLLSRADLMDYIQKRRLLAQIH